MHDMKLALFPLCKVVKGCARSLIIDCQKMQTYFIPSVFAEFLLSSPIIETKALINALSNNLVVAEECISFLIEKKLAYDIESIPFIQNIESEFSSPSVISNAIIETGDGQDKKAIIKQLECLLVQAVEIRNFSFNSEVVIDWLESFLDSSIGHISIITKFDDYLEQKIIKDHRRVKQLYFFHAASDSESFYEDIDLYITKSIKKEMDNSFCGQCSKKFFNLNLTSYQEAQSHNSCLNQKISIDTKGNIKNCPSMKESYGNIRDTTLLEALEKPGFKKYWDITKDQVEVCKECEFRYICTDCRAYIEDPENILSKPLKCGYNPYTCEWEEWSKNPLKQMAIEYYDMHELVY